MSRTDLFFINILPSNDRRTDTVLKDSLSLQIEKSVEARFKYTLVTVGDKRLDPWTTSQYGIQKNTDFSPLIAVNPSQQHPIAVAKKIATLQVLYQNRFAVNFVSGSFISELNAIKDTLTFEDRNLRLKEFLQVVSGLLLSKGSYSFDGSFYKLKNVDIFPKSNRGPVDFFVSGSFETGELSSMANLFFVKNCRPLYAMAAAPTLRSGLGVGICARKTDEEAKEAMNQLFPQDRQGELLFSLSLSNNETPWNIWLKDHLKEHADDDPAYNLKPIKSHLSSAPYLVGSYETVCSQLKKYTDLGYTFFLVDFHKDDFEHVKICRDMLR